MLSTKKHILVADDDAMYRDLATASLEEAGYTVTTAVDGGEAINLLSRTTFDAAIIDLNMPVADGITVIETLRKGTQNATIPVIVITGYDDADAVKHAYRAGATSFLTKPLNWLLFTPHVEFILRWGDTERELRESTASLAFMSDLKSQMMAALAQQFQGPIKTVLGFSQLMEKEVYGAVAQAEYKDMIGDIAKSAYTLNTALLKVMNFGRSLTTNLQLDSGPVLALEAVRMAIAAVEHHAERRGIRIVSHIDIPDDSTLHADAALLAQALRSVVANAVRLSPRDGEVIVRASINSQGAMLFSAGDTGPAMPQDLVAEVNDVSHPHQGFMAQAPFSAVSIKIAKILTEAHSGSFNVRPNPDGGNLVSLTIPSNARDRAAQRGDDARSQPANTAVERLARISAELAADPRIAKSASAASAPAALSDAPARLAIRSRPR